jgi:hypothetical protein
MLGLIFRVVGSIVILLWGLIHIVPVRSILRGFGKLTPDNARIVTMTWVAEGLSLCFVGALVGLITYYGILGRAFENTLVFAVSGFLLATALLSLLTGARNRSVWLRLCPLIKTVVAALFILSSTVLA